MSRNTCRRNGRVCRAGRVLAWISCTQMTPSPVTSEPTWDSLKQYETPQWNMDGKFGIFIHWDAYAAPAAGSEWYPRNMYQG